MRRGRAQACAASGQVDGGLRGVLAAGLATATLLASGCSAATTVPRTVADDESILAAPRWVSASDRSDSTTLQGAPPVGGAAGEAGRDPSSAATDRPRPRTSPLVAVRPEDDVELPARSGQGRRVVYALSRQRAWLVNGDGEVTRTYLVSGQKIQPGKGTYEVYSKSRHTSSAVSAETMEFMVRFTYGRYTGAPIGFHSIPVGYDGEPAQSSKQLGKPLSAGCIRQRRSDAKALWKFATIGTTVVVTR